MHLPIPVSSSLSVSRVPAPYGVTCTVAPTSPSPPPTAFSRDANEDGGYSRVLPSSNRHEVSPSPASSSSSALSSSSSSSSSSSWHRWLLALPLTRKWQKQHHISSDSRENSQRRALTPDLEYELIQKQQIKRSTILLSISLALLIGSGVGIAFSVSRLRHSLTSPQSDKSIGDSSVVDSDADSEDDKIEWATSSYLYTSALFIVILVISLVYSLRSAGRLALYIHYRNLTHKSQSSTSSTSSLSTTTSETEIGDSQSSLGLQRPEESRFWQQLAYFCGPRGGSSKNSLSTGGPSALPTYGHAVRQAVLKRSARHGGPPRDFYHIGEEEVELERIRRLGGAPPSYPINPLSDVRIGVPSIITSPPVARLTR